MEISGFKGRPVLVKMGKGIPSSAPTQREVARTQAKSASRGLGIDRRRIHNERTVA